MRVILLGLLIACGDKEESSLTGDAANGETLFATNCSACHGADATGASAPDLTSGVQATSTFTDEQLSSVISNGVGSMPAISTLDEQGIADVIAYLRTLE